MRGRKRRNHRGRTRDLERAVISTKGGPHLENKKVVKLSNAMEVKQDGKLDEAIGHVNQEVISDLFKSSFTKMVSVEFI